MNERYMFRGKRVDNGEWAKGFYATDYPNTERTMILCHDKNGEFGGLIYHEVDPSTVGQCTGLKDRNGKLVFEGDIFGLRDGCQFEVVWDVECARYIGTRIKASPERMICYVGMCDKNGKSVVEIIGNIHDTPELVEGAE